MMRLRLLLFFLFMPIFAAAPFAPAQMYAAYPSIGNFSSDLNVTLAYINIVNKSSYIIFYPNLTAAYSYVSEAKKVAGSNPQYAGTLLSEARASAETQRSSMYKYRSESVAVLAIIAVALAILIYMYMRPKAKAKARNKRVHG